MESLGLNSARNIARLEVKDGSILRTIQFEGVRKVGELDQVLENVPKNWNTECCLNFCTATLYSREPELELLARIRPKFHFPIIYCGGISSREQAQKIIGLGADRIGLNSALFKTPRLLDELIGDFGAQSVVVHVDVKRVDGKFMAFSKAGREATGKSLQNLLSDLSQYRDVEILLNSVSTQGTNLGFPYDLAKEACNLIDSERLILSGGVNARDGAKELAENFNPSAVASSRIYLEELGLLL